MLLAVAVAVAVVVTVTAATVDPRDPVPGGHFIGAPAQDTEIRERDRPVLCGTVSACLPASLRRPSGVH